VKRGRVAYPCCMCLQDCVAGQPAIQCDGCESWSHLTFIIIKPFIDKKIKSIKHKSTHIK